MELIDRALLDIPSDDNEWEALVKFADDVASADVIEAIPKDQYEQRLKADMVAMLTMLRQDLLDKLAEEKSPYHISDVGIGLEIAIKIIEEYEEKLK